MTNPVKDIYKFNKDRGLLDKDYDDKKECAFPIEEALEGMGDLSALADKLKGEAGIADSSPKGLSRQIIALANMDGEPDVSDVDRLDRHLDIIVFSFGSIFKLGLSPQEAMKALGVVMQANLTKPTAKDSHGKVIKQDDFVGPEAELQKILNIVGPYDDKKEDRAD